MSHCINIKNSIFIDLLNEARLVDPKLHEAVLASKVTLWQEKNNNFDRFPTIEEITKSSNSVQLLRKGLFLLLNN